MSKITLELGAMAPSLEFQLRPFKFKKSVVKRWDKLSEATSLLYVHGMINESSATRARHKLVKEIQKAITSKAKTE